MAEEKKEKWLNYLALTTVILAVCATLSTFIGITVGLAGIFYFTNGFSLLIK